MIRNKWHKDLLEYQKEIAQDLLINQAWLLFQKHDIDYVIKNKTWFAEYTDYVDFQSDRNVKDFVKRSYLFEYWTPPYIKAYCSVCNTFSNMKSDYSKGFYTETYNCCGMGARMRGMYEYIVNNFEKNNRVYIQEVLTPSYKAYENYFGDDNIIGSEFLGSDKNCGEYYYFNKHKIMHQDCTKLSFRDNSMDLIISQAVFEHIFNYKQALSEILRILKNDGCLVLSIPFFYDSQNSVMLAKQEKSGEVIQIIEPPEIHGNPVDGSGALAYWHHGWEFIEAMKDVGYRDVKVHFYNNLYKGYLGLQSLITGMK